MVPYCTVSNTLESLGGMPPIHYCLFLVQIDFGRNGPHSCVHPCASILVVYVIWRPLTRFDYLCPFAGPLPHPFFTGAFGVAFRPTGFKPEAGMLSHSQGMWGRSPLGVHVKTGPFDTRS